MNIQKLALLKTNYNYFIIDDKSNAMLIDCSSASNILEFIENSKINLKYILITHHHYDHTDGLKEVKAKTKAKVLGSKKTKEIIDEIDEVIEFKDYKIDDFEFKAVDTKAHTLDHTSYYFEKEKAFFSGDSLFVLGCGRLFEGSYKMLLETMSVIKSLPEDTIINTGHNYFKDNLRFVRALEYFGDLKKVQEQNLDSSSCLKMEKALNPFLNFDNLEFKKFLNKEDLTDIDFLKYLRERKNNYTIS